jgi:hypothetical protein
MLCLGMHCNVMLRFMVQALQNPPLCSSTTFPCAEIMNNFQQKYTKQVKISRAKKPVRNNFKPFQLKQGFSCSGCDLHLQLNCIINYRYCYTSAYLQLNLKYI